jgi:hypothetical protein
LLVANKSQKRQENQRGKPDYHERKLKVQSTKSNAQHPTPNAEGERNNSAIQPSIDPPIRPFTRSVFEGLVILSRGIMLVA